MTDRPDRPSDVEGHAGSPTTRRPHDRRLLPEDRAGAGRSIEEPRRAPLGIVHY